MTMTFILRYLPTPAMAAAVAILLTILTLILAICAHTILSASQQSTVPKTRRKGTPTHVLIVLGSGGHTAEMLSMLRRMPLDPNIYSFRTYVVTSGDSFSASKAVEFEANLQTRHKNNSDAALDKEASTCYEVVTVPRARRVHQSYLTAPLSTVQCFWACLQVLRGRHPDQRPNARNGGATSATTPYPDLILTNGPATAVCVVLGAKLLRFSHALCTLLLLLWRRTPTPSSTKDDSATTTHKLRTIFIETWARVTTLSLSGKILLPFVDRFLVQWPNLEGKRAWRGMRKTEFVGTVIE